MSNQTPTSSRFSSIDVTNSARFHDEISFTDLTMDGTSLAITVTEDVVIESTATEAPWGVSLLAVGPVVSTSTGSYNWVLSGVDDTVNVGGSVVLGYSTTTTPVPIVEAVFHAASGTARLGFFDTTAVEQPTTAITPAAAAGTGTGDVVAATTTFGGYTLGEVVAALLALGLLAPAA